jgi:hypothetical protein
MILQIAACQRYRTRAALWSVLEAALGKERPPSMAAVDARIVQLRACRVSTQALAYFLETCERISARYGEVTRRDGRERHAVIEAELRTGVDALPAVYEAPTHRTILATLAVAPRHTLLHHELIRKLRQALINVDGPPPFGSACD